MIWHTQLEKQWQNFPQHQQILMICNELNRAENLQSDLKEYRNALERALELTDFMIDDPKNRRCLREILRARRILAMVYDGDYPQSNKLLQRGMIQLNVAAWSLMGSGN